MSSSTLTLSPHELFFLPPNTPATAPAEQLLVKPEKGEAYSVLFRLVQILPLKDNDAWLYFRDERHSEDEIRGGGHVCLGCSTCDGDKATPEAISEQIAADYGTLRYWVSPGREFGIALSSDSSITVSTRPFDQNAQETVSDYGSSLDAVGKWSSEEVAAFCSSIWTPKRSPSRHVLHWQRLSKAERATVRVPSSLEDRERLLDLLHDVLLLQCHHFKLPHYGRARTFAAELPSKRPQSPADEWANRLRRALLDILAPTPGFPTFPKPTPRVRRDLWDGVVCSEQPTHHELIEAQCQLREFLAPHLSPDEIEALFRIDTDR